MSPRRMISFRAAVLRLRRQRVVSVPLLLVAFAWMLLGCEPDARNDAVIYLDRVGRLDLDDSVADRRRLVRSLASLPLSSPEVQGARDACVEAHETILEAEQLTDRARAAVERYEDESQIPITARQRIESDISESGRLIERSGPMFDTCHRRTRDLEVRYRARREGSE